MHGVRSWLPMAMTVLRIVSTLRNSSTVGKAPASMALFAARDAHDPSARTSDINTPDPPGAASPTDALTHFRRDTQELFFATRADHLG